MAWDRMDSSLGRSHAQEVELALLQYARRYPAECQFQTLSPTVQYG